MTVAWVAATGSAHKLREMAEILAPLGIRLDRPAELGLSLEIDEWGATFAVNAALKAIGHARAAGRPALADDSGLEIDALGGRPGVHSARFAGRHGDDGANNARMLAELAAVPAGARTARYRCVVAAALPLSRVPAPVLDVADAVADGLHTIEGMLVVTASGRCDGHIGFEPRGAGGFGYDPYFVTPDGRHMAELDASAKHAISHRGIALRRLVAELREVV